MRFITEDELRTMYRQIPFNQYKLEKDCRLTPGAKQFLVDFRIDIIIDKLKESEELDKEEEVISSSCGDKVFEELALKIKNFVNAVKDYDRKKAAHFNSIAISIYKGMEYKPELEERSEIDLIEEYMLMDIGDKNFNLFCNLVNFYQNLNKDKSLVSKKLDEHDPIFESYCRIAAFIENEIKIWAESLSLEGGLSD